MVVVCGMVWELRTRAGEEETALSTSRAIAPRVLSTSSYRGRGPLLRTLLSACVCEYVCTSWSTRYFSYST